MDRQPDIIIFNPDQMHYITLGMMHLLPQILTGFSRLMRFLSGMLSVRIRFVSQVAAVFFPVFIRMPMAIEPCII